MSAYIDGVLVGSHLAAAAAELEERDEGERQLKGQDHLHTPEITCVQAKITDPLVTLLYALCFMYYSYIKGPEGSINYRAAILLGAVIDKKAAF